MCIRDRLSSSSYSGYATASVSVTAGNHSIIVSVNNAGGPSGVGAQIVDPSGNELWNSLSIIGQNPSGSPTGSDGTYKSGDGGGAGGGGGGYPNGGQGGQVQGGDQGGYSGANGQSLVPSGFTRTTAANGGTAASSSGGAGAITISWGPGI